MAAPVIACGIGFHRNHSIRFTLIVFLPRLPALSLRDLSEAPGRQCVPRQTGVLPGCDLHLAHQANLASTVTTYLGAGFPLEMLSAVIPPRMAAQRLPLSEGQGRHPSRPHLRSDNWYTRGASLPVLSF